MTAGPSRAGGFPIEVHGRKSLRGGLKSSGQTIGFAESCRFTAAFARERASAERKSFQWSSTVRRGVREPVRRPPRTLVILPGTIRGLRGRRRPRIGAGVRLIALLVEGHDGRCAVRARRSILSSTWLMRLASPGRRRAGVEPCAESLVRSIRRRTRAREFHRAALQPRRALPATESSRCPNPAFRAPSIQDIP